MCVRNLTCGGDDFNFKPEVVGYKFRESIKAKVKINKKGVVMIMILIIYFLVVFNEFLI